MNPFLIVKAALALALGACVPAPADASAPAPPAAGIGLPTGDVRTVGRIGLPGVEYGVRTSVASGRRFSVFVHRPPQAAPAAGYPVVYFLDAEASLSMVIDSARLLAEAGRMDPVVLVGIGVPQDDGDIAAWHRKVSRDRSYDYTPATEPERVVRSNPDEPHGGGADGLLAFLVDEVRPALAAALPIDPGRQLMTGHSFGGLFTLHALITRPDAFSHYLISSPSIWYGEGAVLDGRPGFEKRLQRLARPPRVFMAVGRDEQPYAGNADRLKEPPARHERLRYRRMVDNLEDAAAWLRSQGLTVETRVAMHADHGSSKLVNLVHGLQYLLGSGE